MNATQAAYEKGYHVTEEGVVKAPSGSRVFPYLYRGRPAFSFRHARLIKRVYVHRLVAWQKYGHRAAEGLVVFKDGNRLNCAHDNIALKDRGPGYVTRRTIREEERWGLPICEIAARHKMGKGAVWRLLNNGRHVDLLKPAVGET